MVGRQLNQVEDVTKHGTKKQSQKPKKLHVFVSHSGMCVYLFEII